jgi:predicted metal-dependent hydrolase
LRISPAAGLEVVIPKGFSRDKIPDIVKGKEEWIRETFTRLNVEERLSSCKFIPPESVHLRAVGRLFSVEYVARENGSTQLSQLDGSSLEIAGNVSDIQCCRSLLLRWLQLQGKRHLIPLLGDVSTQTRLNFDSIQIRGQKSRWGSCSARGTISLNYKLLFLPPRLVNYILVHELCHTVQMNHSAKFWSLVGKFEPDFRSLDAQMNNAAESYVPGWVG